MLSVGRNTFYARYQPKPICHEYVRLKAAVRHVHRDMDATYGTRRMTAELRELGFNVGRYKVRQLMKSLRLVAKRPKQHRYPMSGHQPTGEVIFHSDQGGLNTSDAFQRCMKEYNVASSMSRRGNCLDNAITERFFRS